MSKSSSGGGVAKAHSFRSEPQEDAESLDRERSRRGQLNDHIAHYRRLYRALYGNESDGIIAGRQLKNLRGLSGIEVVREAIERLRERAEARGRISGEFDEALKAYDRFRKTLQEAHKEY